MPLQCAKCKTRHWNKTRGGWVYLAQAIEPHANSLTKIGWSSQPHVRMTALRDPDGQKVKMIVAMPCNTREAENVMHQEFAAYRVTGEWFALSPELIDKAKGVDLFDLPEPKRTPLEWIERHCEPTEPILDSRGNVVGHEYKRVPLRWLDQAEVRNLIVDRSESQE